MAPATGRHEKENTMAKSIKFTASGSCSALGNFAPGDVYRNLPDALADHLVKEAMCAKFIGVTVQAEAPKHADAQEAMPSSTRKQKQKAN